MIFGFLTGFVVTALLTAVAALRRSADVRALRRRLTVLEGELARLRNLPLEEDLHSPPEPEAVGAEQA